MTQGTELVGLLDLHRNNNEWGDYTNRILDQNGFFWPSNGGTIFLSL